MLAFSSRAQVQKPMATRVSVRHKRPSLKKLRADGYEDYAHGDDDVTIMDMIRTFRKPTEQQQRPAQPVSEEEASEDEVRTIADVDSSGEDQEEVGQHFKKKRKRKSRDLYELLQRERPVSPLTPDLQDDGSPQIRKSKKSDFSEEKNSHDANSWGDVILEAILGSSPLSTRHPIKKLAGSPLSNKADYTGDVNPQCGHGKVNHSLRESWNADNGIKRMGAAPVLNGGAGVVRLQFDEKRGRRRRLVAEPLETLETIKNQRNVSRRKAAGTSSDSNKQAAKYSAPAHLAPCLDWSIVPIMFGEEEDAPQESDEDKFIQHVEVVVQETQNATALELKEELASQRNFVEECVTQEAHDVAASILTEELPSQSYFVEEAATAKELKEELYSRSHHVEEGVVPKTQDATAQELEEELPSQSHYAEKILVEQAQDAAEQELKEELSSQSHLVEGGVVPEIQDATAQKLEEEIPSQSHHADEVLVEQIQGAVAQVLKEELSSRNDLAEEDFVPKTQDATAEELKEELPSQSHYPKEILVEQTQDVAAQALKEELLSQSHVVVEGVPQQSQDATAREEELSSQSHNVEEGVVKQTEDAVKQISNEQSCSQSHHEEGVVQQAQDATEQELMEELSSESHYMEESVVLQTQDAHEQKLIEQVCSQSHYEGERVVPQAQDATEQESKEELSSQSYYEGVVEQTQDASAQELKEEIPAQNHYVEQVVEQQTQVTTELELEEELSSQINHVEVVVQISLEAGAQELKKEFSQSHYVEESVVEQNPDSTAQELKEELSPQRHFVEEGGIQPSQAATEKEFEDELSSDRLEDDAKQGGHELPPSECHGGNQTKHTAGQMQDAALHSLEEIAAAVPNSEISASGFPTTDEFVCSQRVDSACVPTFENLEECDSADPDDEEIGLHPDPGIVEEVCDIFSPDPNHPPKEFVRSLRVDFTDTATFEKLEKIESSELLEEDSALGIVEEVCDFSSPERNQPPEVFVCSQRVDSTAAATSEKLEHGKSAKIVAEVLPHGIMSEVCEFSNPGPNQSPEELVCTDRVDADGGATIGKLECEASELVDDDVMLHLADDIVEEASDFSSPGPNQPPKDFVCPLRMDSGDSTTFEKVEEGNSAKRVEDVDGLHIAHSILEEECGHLTAPVDDGDDMADDSCERPGEDVLDFPVILSQPRRSRTEEECPEDTVISIQGAPEAESSWSRSITRASLRSKIIRPDGEVVISVTESSPPQSQCVESVLPECVFNSECDFYCGDVCDPPVGDRSRAAVSDHPLPLGVMTVPLISDAEFEQIESFNYAGLQDEWQNAGKFLNHIELSLFDEDAVASTHRKRKLCDPENLSDQVKRVAIEALLQQEVPFGRVQETSPESAPEKNSVEDEHVPTALSKAGIVRNGETRGDVQDASPERVLEENSVEDEFVPTALSRAAIERNGERRLAVDRFPSPIEETPSIERRYNAYEEPDRGIARGKRKAVLEKYPQSTDCEKPKPSPRCLAQSFDPLLDSERSLTDCPETSPESNCDPVTIADSNASIDLLASEKLGDEESSEDFEPPSKLPCRRKTISPLSQMQLLRASDSTSQPANESPAQKIPVFRIKLDGGLSGRHEETSPIDNEPIPHCRYLEPNNKTSNFDDNNGAVVSLDSSEEDTDDSSSRQEDGSGPPGEEAARKLSPCRSPNSPSPSTSPEFLTADSSQNTSSLDPRDLQSLRAASSRGILITGARPCKGLCKCPGCTTSRSKAGTAADFISSQMKTFQLVAGRLALDIKSLRETIETSLPNPGETAKIQETLQKSRNIEEAAEKNLTNLLRDCRRYCKLTKTKPTTMRKIVFADEAGKKLCHVKTFQSQSIPKSVLDTM